MSCPHMAGMVARKSRRLGTRLEGTFSEAGLDAPQLLLGFGDYLTRRLLPSRILKVR